MKKLHIHYLLTHGIGDIVMGAPVLHALAKRRPVNFSITVKSEVEAQVINELCPGLNIKYIYFQNILNKKGTIRSFLILIKEIRKLSPDVIIALYGIKSQKSSLISFLSGIKIRIGWKGPFSFLNTLTLEPKGIHKIDENLRVLQVLNSEANENEKVYLKYKPKVIEFSNPKLENNTTTNNIKIVVSPGSGELEKHKRWPEERFSLLINKIHTEFKNAMVFLVGVKRERNLCEQILENVNDKQRVLNLAGDLDVRDLLLLLKQVDLTITNCNGVSHLACSAESPIIGLYGPTDFRITGPKSKNFIPVTLGLDCAPCYSKDYLTGCGNPICIEHIRVDDVFVKVIDLFRKINIIN